MSDLGILDGAASSGGDGEYTVDTNGEHGGVDTDIDLATCDGAKAQAVVILGELMVQPSAQNEDAAGDVVVNCYHGARAQEGG